MRTKLQPWEKAVWAELRERVDQTQLDGDPHTRMWMLDVISEQVQLMQAEMVDKYVAMRKVRADKSPPTPPVIGALRTGS